MFIVLVFRSKSGSWLIYKAALLSSYLFGKIIKHYEETFVPKDEKLPTATTTIILLLVAHLASNHRRTMYNILERQH